ncbi:unnamed protein product [Rotaria sp. Silwood2]|nr:unnamed protein product [Rotaria sp. Silwood2]
MTCNLHRSCGVLYKTYAGYKSHIYRQHLSELHSTEKNHNNLTTIPVSKQEDNMNLLVESDLTNDDINDQLNFANDNIESMVQKDDYETGFDDSVLSFGSITNDGKQLGSMWDIKRSYILFMLQLREECLLPKNVMSIISTYIITLMQNLETLLEKKAFNYTAESYSAVSSSRKENKKAIEFDQLKHVLDDIRNAIQSNTKNEYQFVKQCEKYFAYTSPEEIVLSSAGEVPEHAYFIPIEKTLSSMLNYQPLVIQILENIQQQQTTTKHDDDLMFSIRDGYHGSRLDHDSLLLQLYLDDIGLTNPIGSKRDEHKMCMIYFSLEDIPDQLRSKVDFIQLVGVCEIGGFRLCFNSGHFCRRCYVTYDEKNLPIPLSQIKIRTIFDHDDLVKRIMNDPNKFPLMGVIDQSPLNDLIGFHPIVSLPGDIMHDFIEGACPLVVMSLLKQASSMRLITYGEK